MLRPSRDRWALLVAQAVATRAECSRRLVGAVILDRKGRIAGSGYNGAAPGKPNCLDGYCPRAHTNVPPGSSYDTGPGKCIAVHAELNALLDVDDRSRLEGATLYITDAPCDGCKKIIGVTAISDVVWPEGRYTNG